MWSNATAATAAAFAASTENFASLPGSGEHDYPLPAELHDWLVQAGADMEEGLSPEAVAELLQSPPGPFKSPAAATSAMLGPICTLPQNSSIAAVPSAKQQKDAMPAAPALLSLLGASTAAGYLGCASAAASPGAAATGQHGSLPVIQHAASAATAASAAQLQPGMVLQGSRALSLQGQHTSSWAASAGQAGPLQQLQQRLQHQQQQQPIQLLQQQQQQPPQPTTGVGPAGSGSAAARGSAPLQQSMLGAVHPPITETAAAHAAATDAAAMRLPQGFQPADGPSSQCAPAAPQYPGPVLLGGPVSVAGE